MKKKITTLAEFKKAIRPGVQVHGIYHQAFAGRNPKTGEVRYKDEDRGVREISQVKSTRFAFKTPLKQEPTQFTDIWMAWPKPSECKFNNGDIIILLDSKPILTYSIIEK